MEVHASEPALLSPKRPDLRVKRETIDILEAPVNIVIKRPESPKGPPPTRRCGANR